MATAPRIMLLGRRDRVVVGEVSSRRFTWIETSSPQLHSVAASNSHMGLQPPVHGVAASRAAASHLVWTVVQVWLLLVRLVEVEVDQGEHHLDRWTEHADTALATLHLPPLLYLLYLPMHLLVYANVPKHKHMDLVERDHRPRALLDMTLLTMKHLVKLDLALVLRHTQLGAVAQRARLALEPRLGGLHLEAHRRRDGQ